MRALVLALGLWLGLFGMAAAQDRAEDLLLGVWDVELVNADGSVTTMLEFYPDGTYEGYRGIKLKEIGQTIAIGGGWSVSDETDRSFALTLEEDGGATLTVEWQYADAAGNTLKEAGGSGRMTRSDAIPSRERPRTDAEEA